jgi:uncharacterized protein YaaW (UPF0174 family)
MNDLFSALDPADFSYLAGIIQSDFNATNDSELTRLADLYGEESSDENRTALFDRFEKEIRYVGSAELAYGFRSLSGQEPGVSFSEIVRDVAKMLKVGKPPLGTDREQVEWVASEYATAQFSELSQEEQREMLESLGVERDKAEAFLKKSAGVFALPMLIEAFNLVIVQGLIKTIIFGTIAKIIGQQLATRLFTFLVGRLPWWVNWIGPAAWTLSIGWTTIDIQGPARRKTVPVVLYLGICSMREAAAQPAD